MCQLDEERGVGPLHHYYKTFQFQCIKSPPVTYSYYYTFCTCMTGDGTWMHDYPCLV